MSHLKAQIAKARAEGRTHDAEAMERIEAVELRQKRRHARDLFRKKVSKK